jgi:hypothetical protein
MDSPVSIASSQMAWPRSTDAQREIESRKMKKQFFLARQLTQQVAGNALLLGALGGRDRHEVAADQIIWEIETKSIS